MGAGWGGGEGGPQNISRAMERDREANGALPVPALPILANMHTRCIHTSTAHTGIPTPAELRE